MALSSAARIRREWHTSSHVPYLSHVSENIISTRAGDYAQVFRLGGLGFETADDARLNNWHERLNVLWRNLASPHVALWTHVVRHRELIMAVPAEPGFAGSLNSRYRERLSRERLMLNELYLTVIYRPVVGAAPGLLARLLAGSGRSGTGVAEAVDACDKLARTVAATLQECDPERLGLYRSGSHVYSRVLEFLAQLLDGERQRVPLPRAPLAQVLATARCFIGNECIEYRQPAGTRVAAVLGVKEYPTPTVVGMYDRLLSAPFAFVLTQSFAFLSKPAAQGLLQRQYNRMVNAGDFSVTQAQELKLALDALTSSQFVMGDHHLTLQVLAEATEDWTQDALQQRFRILNDHVALARSLLADSGMVVAREDLGLEAAYWAQLPGHFSMRTRKAPITSRNFCAMSPFHNHPAGRATGNHWGDALALFVTSAGSAYHFSLHASDPRDPDGGSRKDTGHTLICGPTGSGKTVLIGFLLTMLARQGATQIVFDKDQGLEILVLALGGRYLPLRNGVATGCNPLQLPQHPDNEAFLKAWLRVLARPASGRVLMVREEADLEQALKGTLALEAPARCLSRLVEFLDPTDPDGVHARLSRWCRSTGGDLAWVFDNPEDRVAPFLCGSPLVGFDVTDFLDQEAIRAPLTLYLFHLVRRMLDGRRLVCWMDEFWRLLADRAFEGFATDGPRTWRKLNGAMCLATQSVSDVLAASISRTLIEQTPTKVFFPNPEGSRADYVEGLGLSEREFRLIKEQLTVGSRQFLVRQGNQSVVCQLDLKGLEGELAVISGRARSVERLHTLIDRVGDDPQYWLPLFMAEATSPNA
ncbi:MAG TPA: VirB4 family type IV secretion/conjugal transfer ATPase [Steroidobacteraceae bacterium]|jgi:type IV secretion system protein VirB4|nr:VirB4 family type IV secretion/conjugal transfer ATPase [Steroidobacteraceae bacterium]